MTPASEKIQALKTEQRQLQVRIDELEKLTTLVPDVCINRSRWGVERYSAASVNDRVNLVIIGYNCGCCEDKPVEVWPYIAIDDKMIFSDPPSFIVGERDPYRARDIAYPEWPDRLRKRAIPEAIIERIQAHFDAQRDEEYEED